VNLRGFRSKFTSIATTAAVIKLAANGATEGRWPQCSERPVGTSTSTFSGAPFQSRNLLLIMIARIALFSSKTSRHQNSGSRDNAANVTFVEAGDYPGFIVTLPR
jgi:hypothetical protein